MCIYLCILVYVLTRVVAREDDTQSECGDALLLLTTFTGVEAVGEAIELRCFIGALASFECTRSWGGVSRTGEVLTQWW